MNDYEKDLEIDPESLDLEWLRHSNIFMKYSEQKADAKRELDRANEKVKTIRSELILEARKGGEELIGVKPTDSIVEAWYRVQDKYIDVITEKIEAEFSYNILDGAVYAFQNRKTALENLVKLMIAGYFAGPVEPKDLSRGEVEKKVIKQSMEKERENLNLKRRRK
jgi:hypothetical protein